MFRRAQQHQFNVNSLYTQQQKQNVPSTDRQQLASPKIFNLMLPPLASQPTMPILIANNNIAIDITRLNPNQPIISVNRGYVATDNGPKKLIQNIQINISNQGAINFSIINNPSIHNLNKDDENFLKGQCNNYKQQAMDHNIRAQSTLQNASDQHIQNAQNKATNLNKNYTEADNENKVLVNQLTELEKKLTLGSFFKGPLTFLRNYKEKNTLAAKLKNSNKNLEDINKQRQVCFSTINSLNIMRQNVSADMRMSQRWSSFATNLESQLSRINIKEKSYNSFKAICNQYLPSLNLPEEMPQNKDELKNMINSAYKKTSVKIHPDKHSNERAKFVEIFQNFGAYKKELIGE